MWKASLGMLHATGSARPPAVSQAQPLLAKLLSDMKASSSQGSAASDTPTDQRQQQQQQQQESPALAQPSPLLSPSHPSHDSSTTTDPRPATTSESSRAVAAAALAAARAGTSVGAAKAAGKVAVTQTQRFAGKDISVTKLVEEGSSEVMKAARKAAAQAAATKGSMEAMLADLEKKKKVSVLDKSKMDWKEHKSSDADLEAELELYKKSGDQYLSKVDFLKRAELRQYEKERDQKLAADVRNRGRL
ncbi:MAG: hypothetical protein WDW38_010901 [Sanguina aurantia]